MGASSGSATKEPLAKPLDNGETKNKKGRFSFLQKAKTLVFEQEIILEEKDLEEPMGIGDGPHGERCRPSGG